MRTRSRRGLDTALVAGGALVAAGVAVIGAMVADQERVARLWAGAEVATDGSGRIAEEINYDFGVTTGKHGIFRVIPGLTPETPVTVSSADAPDDTLVTPEGDGIRIRIGDPATTISGSHTYRIDYDLPDISNGELVAWDAVGTGWDVPIEHATIDLVAPYRLTDPTCFIGAAGSTDRCDVEQVEPGHLVVAADDLDAHRGLTVQAGLGARLDAAPALPPPPSGSPDDPGTGLARPAGVAMLGVLAAGLPTMLLVRRAGRERVAAGGAATAAYGGRPPSAPLPPVPADVPAGSATPGAASLPPAPPPPPFVPPGQEPGEVTVDQHELEEMATTDFAPPEYLTPAQGGIVLAESVRPEHRTAWLIQAAIDGAVDLEEEGGKTVRLRRTARGSPEVAAVLDTAFAGRSEVELGSYDPSFASAWSALTGQLDDWRRASGYWDPRGGARQVGAIVLGALASVAGAVIMVGGGFAANRWGPVWLLAVALGAVVLGVGLAGALTSWELRVRTAAGSAAWLRVESFRRFLAGSEAYHAEEAARRGVLREYTAWAVAVGEIDRWARAVSAASTTIPADAGLSYVYVAPLLLASTTATATAPSSSGSGGGSFGGSVGGGAGGGGGGSW